MKDFLRTHKHIWFISLLLGYLIFFVLLEKIISADYDYFVCYIPFLDDNIPFCEWFVIPYVFWYPYMAAVGFYLAIQKDGREFIRAIIFVIGGMLFCLLICAIFPNGQNLRVEEFPRENILSALVGALYASDTNTNVLPSMHVLGSLSTHSVLMRSKFPIFQKRWIRIFSLILCLLICLSTVFIKQHSALDGIVSLILFFPLSFLVYGPLTKFLDKKYPAK